MEITIHESPACLTVLRVLFCIVYNINMRYTLSILLITALLSPVSADVSGLSMGYGETQYKAPSIFQRAKHYDTMRELVLIDNNRQSLARCQQTNSELVKALVDISKGCKCK